MNRMDFLHTKKYIKMEYVLLGILAFFSAACGYRFSGGGSLPQGIRHVCVETLQNKTFETGVENIITNDIIYEFTRNNKELLSSRDRADAVLTGVVESVKIGSISHRDGHVSLERRVRVNVSLELTNRDGEIVWTAKNISADEAYDVTSDKLITELNRQKAIEKLSKRISERFFNNLTNDF